MRSRLAKFGVFCAIGIFIVVMAGCEGSEGDSTDDGGGDAASQPAGE